MARKTLLKGVGDFAEVTPTLYRGSQPTHEGFKELAKMGIKIVVDVRGTKRDGERKEVRKLGMEYVSIPWHCPFPKDELFARFLKLLRDNPGKRVFVHCRLGDDRDGMMIASYRMTIEAWSAEEAMKEMQTFGFTRAHHFICPGLARYEKHFPEHLRKNPIFKELRAQDGPEKAQ
jgi:tyrosine-protein phosphatase SIW14